MPHTIAFIDPSTDSHSRKPTDLPFIREWSETSTWRGLEILDTKHVNDNKTFVSFEAHFTQQGEDHRHREKSLFEREHSQWRFVSGEDLKNPTVRYEMPI